eukprot:262983-Amphidinium_carterae.1
MGSEARPASSRVEDMVLLSEECARHEDRPVGTLVTDVRQDAARKPWSNGIIRSLTTSSQLFHHGQQRMLSLRELFALMGFPADTNLSALSHTQAKDLLGESMAVPSVTLVLLALMMQLPIFSGEGGI